MMRWLESEGGKIFALLCVLLLLCAIIIAAWATHREPTETSRALVSNAFTATFTALIMRLSARNGAK